jgi:hypothetical protein
METLLHHYAFGKPKEQLDLDARFTGNHDRDATVARRARGAAGPEIAGPRTTLKTTVGIAATPRHVFRGSRRQ